MRFGRISLLLSVNWRLPKADNSLTEQIRVDEERTRLMRQIESLERQMRSTSQPRRQRELYAQLKLIKCIIHNA